jgi:endonuclease I
MKTAHRIVLPFAAWTLSLSLATAQDDGYYDGIEATSPGALRAALHELIDDHQRFPYTSFDTDTWDVLEQADADQDEPNRVVGLYRNASFARQGGGNNAYNREHVWPRSYGFPDNDENLNYPFTDMHSLFLSDADYNFARSNHPFDYCDDGCAEYATVENDGRGDQGAGYPGDSNWQTGEFTDGTWEVWSGRRGDVARALMYMDLRYEGGVHGETGAAEPDLILTDDRERIDSSNTGNNEAVGYMGMLSTLLEWHEQDPVDDIERQHHETVASFQGNRNPFIDRPEWAACVFQGVCSAFTINAGITDAWFDPATSGQGFFVIVWEDIGQVFLGWFTYDAERPPEDLQSIIGEPGHRWLTAQGPFQGDTALLDIYVSSGGVFDAPEPPVGTPVQDGTVELIFSGCNSGTVVYDIPSAGLTGEIAIQRIVLDNVALCESL